MRLETGVVQDGDDWPGIFIRGDHAFALSLQIRAALSATGPASEAASLSEVFMRLGLEGLAEPLESCDARRNPKPQMIARVDIPPANKA
jgi:hypothetical protein